MQNDKMKIKINAPMLNFLAGEIVEIKINKFGKPVDYFWRKRINDSKIDNCVEVVVESTNIEVVAKVESASKEVVSVVKSTAKTAKSQKAE